jgi:hypothetical protein
LSIPGIHTAIIGIGKIHDDPEQCQLSYNLKHAQVAAASVSEQERNATEQIAAKAKEGKTNYFQKPFQELTAPRDVKVEINNHVATITWHTAYAGDAAIDRYEIWKEDVKIATIPFKPQTSKTPYQFEVKHKNSTPGFFIVKVVDKKSRIAEVKVLEG